VQPAVSGPDKREIQSPHAFKAQKRDDTDNKQAHTQIGIASQMRTRKITKRSSAKKPKKTKHSRNYFVELMRNRVPRRLLF
jgi:hypothetical protein